MLPPMPISKLALCALVATAVSCGGSQNTAPTDDPAIATPDPLANTEDEPAPDTSGGAVTVDMLVSKVYQAMVAGDVDAALAYAPTVQQVADICPDLWAKPEARVEIERDIGSMRQAFTESFADCLELVDFASTTPSQPVWEHKNDVNECTGLARMSEASVLVQGRDGNSVRIEIELVTLKDGRVFVADDPTCVSGEYDDYGG